MPADGFTLAVRVSREDEFVGMLERGNNVFEMLFRPARHLPLHLKIIVWQNRSVLAGQITYMAVRRQHLIIIAKVTIDRFGLCRRFNNNDFHGVSYT